MENGVCGTQLDQAVAAYGFAVGESAPRPFGGGHINTTFMVFGQQGGAQRYMLQRINHDVFKDPVGLMENFRAVTDFLRSKIGAEGGDPDRETLTVQPTLAGKPWFVDSDGFLWRCYPFIGNTVTHQQVTSPGLFRQAALTFGRFARRLEDFPAHTLCVTIPRFHDTRWRLEQFLDALKADVCGRAKDCQREIEFVLERQEESSLLVDMLEKGDLPLRVTHNDTKLENVLIDEDTGQGVCVIDLDTVMPGLLLHDFGDAIRYGTNTAAEDEPDTSKVHFSLPLYQVYAGATLEAAGGMMTPIEREMLHWGAKSITFEQAMRFLADYLNGDTYYRTHRPGQNLDRCRVQAKLVLEMEAAWDDMQRAAQ